MKPLMFYVNAFMTLIFISLIITFLILGDFKSAWIAVLPLIYTILNIAGLLED